MLEIELFNLLEGTSDAAFAVTDQGEICSWNKAAEKLFGYTPRKLSTRPAQVSARTRAFGQRDVW